MDQFKLNENILDFWKNEKTFHESISSRSEKMKWKFYDGPPFTSGDPHYGHLLQSAVKDAIPRWMTMRGYQVARKRGWDCHGIPAENFVNKKLGITSKKQVTDEIGVQKYVEECRTMVNNVNDNWKRFVDHIGRWADMENAYFTMHDSYMESVIHLFADLYHNNLIYKGFKVLGYSRALGTALSNSEIAEGYMDRQDPAVTVKLRLIETRNKKLETRKHETTDDGFEKVVRAVIKDEKGRFLMLFHNKHSHRVFPGGRVDKGEDMHEALVREASEEIGVKIEVNDMISSRKLVVGNQGFCSHYFECKVDGEPKNTEPDKHSKLVWVEIIESENEIGYALKVDDMIIDDVDKIISEFSDFSFLQRVGHQNVEGMKDGSFSLLARTTTPWTLPSNMFGAVNNSIIYSIIFDRSDKQYYVIAKSLLNSFYKNPDNYILVYILNGNQLVGLDYEPLFDYYYKSPEIDSKYHNKVHKILHANFVTEDSGTGIAHEAPAFGEDDYGLVTSFEEDGKIIFPAEKANERLFNPVNDHGEFDEQVTDFAGMNVIESNKKVIEYLKEKGTLVRHETINHSYPHCPRTKEPIIYRAMESRFLKEKELTKRTLPLADTINFVPPEIKKRFVNGLESAPDRNISRSRFWGAPLPIWECEKEDCEERKVFGSIQEISEASGQEVKDLHRPYIDGITVDCECGGEMKRIPEVLDCWFESGSMPFAQDHWMKGKNLETRNKKQENDNSTTEYDIEMGFSASGVREMLSGNKTKTYRLGDKYLSKLNIGNTIGVKHSGTGEIVGSIKILDLDGITFGEIPLITSGHKGFDSVMDKKLIFKQFYNKDIKDDERVTVIDFEFTPYQAGNTTEKEGGEEFSSTADFIAEGLDQTRGWFRSLHVLGAAYTDNIVYKNVVVTGMILAEDGKKMSKSLKNYPDPKGLLEKYGADAFRLYVLGSPVVRAEPLRFQEKGVEQVLKDFVIPFQNVWNFFKTYAKVDEWKDDGTEIYFMRHADRQKQETRKDKQDDEDIEHKDIPLSKEGEEQIQSQDFVERVSRINPDIIITTNRLRAIQTAEGAQKVMKDYLGKEIQIVERDNLVDGFNKDSCGEIYDNLCKEFSGKNVLIVSHRWRFLYLWNELYGTSHEHGDDAGPYGLGTTEISKLPTTKIHNELDQRIFSELHAMISELDNSLKGYEIEPAVRVLIGFMDKLTNRRLRRARRRFWDEGISDDKKAVYGTLWEVLSVYTKLAAPFAPFVCEWIWQEMNIFRKNNVSSIHLEHWPIVSEKNINSELSNEIAEVRKIIKGAMYLRAKKKIKVKQPLQELKFKI